MSTDEVISVQPEESSRDGGPSRRNAVRWTVLIVVALLILAGGLRMLMASGDAESYRSVPTSEVKRGRLVVSVTEGGTLRAMESLEVKSEVEGNNQILEIVPEGTVITQEDVDNGKVLVRLDVSDLEEREASREISFRNAEASYIQAKENYDIQVKQNKSNINAAQLKEKFARMELERYLGAAMAEKLLEGQFEFADLRPLARRQVEKILEDDPELVEEILGDMYLAGSQEAQMSLGGVARQLLRELAADVQLAKQELTRAEDTLYWTERLAENDYVSRDKLTADRLATQRATVQLASAEEELRLFIQYTLPKEAETRHSDYEEAILELDRVRARANSELAQAEANRDSKQRTYELEQERLDKTREMIAKSTIRATKPGVVVYASTSDPWRHRNNPIQEGTSVHQNETIITVPNLDTLAARVNVHETDIAKIKEGQRAKVSLEALPGKSFAGDVAKISPMASSEHRWLNPDVMVYETDVALNERSEGVTPGMSATAEIIIAELKDAIYIPVQAVTTHRGQRICWVVTPDGPEIRRIECGHFTEKFVEVKSGLREGDEVYLAPPEELEEAPGEEEAEAGQAEPEEAEAPGQPPEEQEQAGPEEPQPETRPGEEEAPEAEAGDILDKLQGMSETERAEFFRNMTDEQRRQLFQQFRNMPEEQRRQMMQQFGEGRRGGRGSRQGRGGGRPEPE